MADPAEITHGSVWRTRDQFYTVEIVGASDQAWRGTSLNTDVDLTDYWTLTGRFISDELESPLDLVDLLKPGWNPYKLSERLIQKDWKQNQAEPHRAWVF